VRVWTTLKLCASELMSEPWPVTVTNIVVPGLIHCPNHLRKGRARHPYVVHLTLHKFGQSNCIWVKIQAIGVVPRCETIPETKQLHVAHIVGTQPAAAWLAAKLLVLLEDNVGATQTFLEVLRD